MADAKRPPDDTYARQSFTLRRMKPWQLWGLGIFLVAIVLALIFFG